jgi:predicted ATP-dependent endonuclease of OLD family
MLTFIVEGRSASLLAIDEPDIYLHSDLQRQLLSILKEAGPDILIATHSTELVSDADPNDIVVVIRRTRAARRLKDPSQLQTVFRTLGSNLNPTLTQLAKSRRALFVREKTSRTSRGSRNDSAASVSQIARISQ